MCLWCSAFFSLISSRKVLRKLIFFLTQCGDTCFYSLRHCHSSSYGVIKGDNLFLQVPEQCSSALWGLCLSRCLSSAHQFCGVCVCPGAWAVLTSFVGSVFFRCLSSAHQFCGICVFQVPEQCSPVLWDLCFSGAWAVWACAHTEPGQGGSDTDWNHQELHPAGIAGPRVLPHHTGNAQSYDLSSLFFFSLLFFLFLK